MNSDTLIVAVLGGATTISTLIVGYLRDKKQSDNRNEELSRQLVHDENESKLTKLATFREKRLTQLTELLSELNTDHLDFTEAINFQRVESYQELQDSINKYQVSMGQKLVRFEKLKFQFGDKHLVGLINAHVSIYSNIRAAFSKWNNEIFNKKQKADTTLQELLQTFEEFSIEMDTFESQLESSTLEINKRIEELLVGFGCD